MAKRRYQAAPRGGEAGAASQATEVIGKDSQSSPEWALKREVGSEQKVCWNISGRLDSVLGCMWRFGPPRY